MKRKLLIEMISDSRGLISHKRVITLTAAFLLFAAFSINMFHKLNLEPYMWDTFKWIILGGMGISTTEFFSKPTGAPSDPEAEQANEDALKKAAGEPAKPIVFTPDSNVPSK